MRLASAVAIYFIIWWAVLFAVLPWGIRNPHEVGGTVGEGHEPGAPVNPMLWRKIAITTVIASIVFAIVLGQVKYGWIGFEDIPFLG